MAGIGLRSFMAGRVTEDFTDPVNPVSTISDGFYAGDAMTAEFSPVTNAQKLFSNNRLKQQASGTPTGSITITSDDFTLDVLGKMLGHTYDVTGKKLIYTAADTPPYLALGFVETLQVLSELTYRAWIYYKVMFSEPNVTTATNGENTPFQTLSLPGTYMTDVQGRCYVKQDFTAEAAALTYLSGALGLAQPGGGGEGQ